MPETTPIPLPPIESTIPTPRTLAIINPVMRWLLQSPFHHLVSDWMLLLSFHGATSGKSFLVPISFHIIKGIPTGFSGAQWIHNLQVNPSLEIVMHGVRQPSHADIIEDPKVVAANLHKVLHEIGPQKASHFAFKVNSEPSVNDVYKALEGRKMIRLWPGGRKMQLDKDDE